MSHSPAITRRIQTVEGHLRRVKKMIDDESYCIDVINQSKAVQSALAKIDEMLLEHHLRTCVVDHIKAGKTELATKEVLSVFRRSA